MTPVDVLRAWHQSAQDLLPEGIEVWDAHTHTGENDPDGFTGSAAELIAALDNAGHAGAVIMTSADPGGYEAANLRVLAEADASGGRLLPLLRVDPKQYDEASVRRGIAAGHRGLKLHPRAEAFSMGDPEVAAACRVAAAAGVPVLVHSGRGIASLREPVLRLVDTIGGLRMILAHCGISDLARLGPEAADHPGLYFDTSWWDVTDRLALAAWAPPGRILYASDTPYGAPDLGFVMAMRVAAAAGYGADDLRAHFGGTLHRLLASTDGEDLGPPKGDGFICADAGLLRVHASLHAAIGAAFGGVDPSEAISLARAGCDVHSNVADLDVYRAIAATLDAIVPTEVRSRFRLLVVAAAAALTPQVPVPDLIT